MLHVARSVLSWRPRTQGWKNLQTQPWGFVLDVQLPCCKNSVCQKTWRGQYSWTALGVRTTASNASVLKTPSWSRGTREYILLQPSNLGFWTPAGGPQEVVLWELVSSLPHTIWNKNKEIMEGYHSFNEFHVFWKQAMLHEWLFMFLYETLRNTVIETLLWFDWKLSWVPAVMVC